MVEAPTNQNNEAHPTKIRELAKGERRGKVRAGRENGAWKETPKRSREHERKRGANKV